MIAWSPSRARAVWSAPPAAGAAWQNAPRIWSITCFRRCPVRQWVLTVPVRLRYVLAFDHALCRAVAGAFMRTVLGVLRRRARERGIADGRGGAVAIIQRFGSALNTNVHIHALVMDGVYVEEGTGALAFRPASPPSDDVMDQVLATIERRVERLLIRRGLYEDAADASGPIRGSRRCRSWPD